MNTPKFILISAMCFVLCTIGYTQERAQYKCTYQFDFLRDTLSLEYFRQETYVVQIGENITKGFTYQKFYLDSLITHNPSLHRELFNKSVKESIETMRRTGSLESVRNNEFNNGGFASDLYKDYKKGEIRVADKISIHPFIFKDELKPQDWEILSDTLTILGYRCQKATCHFRGRDYEAWFTTEIPISEGPWKFYGLPGLITKLHDTAKHYSFELTGFQEVNEIITTKISKDYIKVDRIEFIKAKTGEKGQKMAEADMTNVGISNSGEKKVSHYDYIERDYR